MTSSPARILLVDDDPNILDTAKDILEDAHYRVEIAGTAAGALAHLQNSEFDLMIVDLNLPDSTGIALAAQARALRSSLLVILMTGEADVKRDADGPIYDYLLKPVDPQQLLKILAQALNPI